jgi:excisionase family DNA binding protein
MARQLKAAQKQASHPTPPSATAPGVFLLPLTIGVSMARKTITLAEAADIYGVSQRTLRRYINAHRITAYRIGGLKLLRLDPEELDQQLFSRA